jgi:hypothetical protein
MQSALAAVAGTCHSVLKSLIPALKYRSFNDIGNSRQHFTNPAYSSPFFVTRRFPSRYRVPQNPKLLLRKLRPFDQPRPQDFAPPIRPARAHASQNRHASHIEHRLNPVRAQRRCAPWPHDPLTPSSLSASRSPRLPHTASTHIERAHSNEYHSVTGIDSASKSCYTSLCLPRNTSNPHLRAPPSRRESITSTLLHPTLHPTH